MNTKTNTVVIVESPAKASTIEKYLGPGYSVLASYGHVRDLVNKNGSVDPDHDFAMVWGQTERSGKHIDDILNAVKGSQQLLLATDPDREGEAIAWHISQIISQKYKDKTPPMHRVVFHEITKNAVLNAINDPHDLDELLVNAYLARRALDYLVGYSLSPILWQKLPGARSAGRVQSVALRMIVEREQDIEKFKSEEYWTIGGNFKTEKNETFIAKLSIFGSTKLGKMSVTNQEQASEICSKLDALDYAVSSVEKKQIRRNPAPPFTTSTLQQEASRKLGFGAIRTMRTAQKLYEGISINGELTGLITYMRTDSVNLSQEAINDMRKFIEDIYGKNYLPAEKRVYKTKAKNAQEAHEAIRPTSIFSRPDDVAEFLDADQKVLYNLIWKRAIASQMDNALFDQTVAEITDPTGANMFKAVGTTQVFDGFLRVYQEGRDEVDADDDSANLPVLQKGDDLALLKTLPDQHFTQPPPRYTEATLVKHLEELGIGRPSTYAPLIQVLQDREYVTLEKRQFIPSSRGRIVTAFLTNFCLKYVEYDFTANLEDELDDIANGLLNWKNVMRDFWANFSEAVTQMKEIRITEVIDRLEENLEAYLFKDDTERQCKKCNGRLGLRLSKFGAFLGCSNYPECQNRIPILGSQEGVPQNVFETVELGTDPVDKSRITLRNGPYGFYIQVDPSEQAANEGKKKVPKPKRVGLPAGMDPRSVTFDMALLLKELPKTIGTYEDNTISVNTGRFGPYVKCGAVVASIPKSLDFMNISEADAITLIKAKSEKQAKGGKRAAPRRAAPRRGNAAMKVSPIAGEDVTAEMGENATVIAGKKTRAGTGRKTKASAGAAKKTKASARSTSANAKGSSPSGNTRKRKHSPT